MNIIKNCAWYLGQYLRGTRAIAAMEYAIIVGVVVVGVGAAVVAFQGQITEFIQQAGSDITATRATMRGSAESTESTESTDTGG